MLKVKIAHQEKVMFSWSELVISASKKISITNLQCCCINSDLEPSSVMRMALASDSSVSVAEVVEVYC